MGHIGHKGKPAIELDLLIEPKRDDLLNPPRKKISCARRLLRRIGREGYIFRADA